MTIKMKTAVSKMRSLMTKPVTYSMGGSRTGEDGTADCSGAVYAALNAAGASLTVGTTDTLFTDLPSLGFSVVSSTYKYGDVFIFGVKGQSGGSAGHTGIFVSATTVIHCNQSSNGVSIDSYKSVLSNAGSPPNTVYRLGDQDTTEDADSSENTAENMDNSGEIEEYSYIGNRLCIKGWHFASDSSSGTTSGSSGKDYSVNWNSIQSRAQFFVYVCLDLGIPKNTILALAANAFAESSLDPSALEQGGGTAQGHGYFQWSYASNWGDVPNHMNRSYEDAKYQVNFAKSVESQWIDAGYGTWDEFWKGTQSAEYLTNAWVASWERPYSIGNRWSTFIASVDVDSLNFESTNTDNTVDTTGLTGYKEILQIIDATNDNLIKNEVVDLVERQDIKEKNENVTGIENSGIDICLEFEHENPFYIQFLRIVSDGTAKILSLPVLFFPHSSSRTDIGHDYACERTFIIQVKKSNGKTEIVKDILSEISWENSAMEIPSCQIVVPITEAYKFDGNSNVKVIIYQKMFDGVVKNITLDKNNETATIDLDHVIAEWDNRKIPENYTVKNRTFPDVFSQSPFLYSTEFYVDCDAQAQKELINYAFSKQGHLEALTKACELTSNIWWRVGFRYDHYLEIGAFGEVKNYILSEIGQTERHVKIISDVSISRNFSDVFNTLTVYGEKSDSSQASLTLREAYLDQQQSGKSIIEGFPIVILNPTVNNEQKDFYTNITKIASNNSLEYAVLDEFSINLEQAKVIEETQSFNDLAPFANDGETISDEERAKQANILYKAAVRKLITEGRRTETISITVGYLPCNINVLDQIYFDYKNNVVLFDGCSRYCRKVYEKSELFYIVGISTNFDKNLNEKNIITLCKEVYQKNGS